MRVMGANLNFIFPSHIASHAKVEAGVNTKISPPEAACKWGGNETLHIASAAILAASVSYFLAVRGGRILHHAYATWARILSFFSRSNSKEPDHSEGQPYIYSTPKKKTKESRARHRDSTMFAYVGQVSSPETYAQW